MQPNNNSTVGVAASDLFQFFVRFTECVLKIVLNYCKSLPCLLFFNFVSATYLVRCL